MAAILTANAATIINAALRLIGEIDANQEPQAPETQDALEALDMLVKSYQSQGLHLWTKTEGILFLDVGKTDYLIGPNGDECTTLDEFNSSELTLAGIASDLTVTLDTSNINKDDKIGVLLDDGSRQWTTVLSVGASSVTIPSPGLTGAAAIGNSVFTYTNQIDRPVRILQLRRDSLGNFDEIEATRWSREEYFAQPNKTSQGTINNWYYSPQLGDGRLYIWQTANSADQLARFTYERPLEVDEDITVNTDFPAEWMRCLKYNLAVDIAPEYTISEIRLDKLETKAAMLLEDALGFDVENDSISMMPDFRG